MTDLRERTADLLDDRPEMESGLRALLDVDAERDTWTFQDAPLDSGDFGEVVSRGIVERANGDYRLADREALAAALDGEPPGDGGPGGSRVEERDETGTPSKSVGATLGEFVPSPDRRTALLLSGALALLAAVRLVPFPAVLREGDTVLYPNDPYFYRYWVDRTTEAAAGPFDVGAFTDFPATVAKGEPLLVAVTGWFAELLGGGTGGSGTVLAWYPVVAGVLTGGLVYALARRVTDDRRVAVVAVALLAVTPMHAFRTGFGFADHHAFDYLWLGVTAVALVAAIGSDRGQDSDGSDPIASLRASTSSVLVLGVGIAGGTLAWEAGPLLSIPVGIVVVFLAASAIRAGRSPLVESLPVVAGVGVGAATVGVVHLALGWHTAVVAGAPALLLVGTLGVTLLAEAGWRRDLSAHSVLAVETASGVVGVVVVAVVFPDVTAVATERIGTLLAPRGITETASLVSGQFGAITGPLYNFGLVFLLAIPSLVWGTRRVYRSHDPKWLVLSTYAWFFLVLALVQVRFAGQLGLFLTPFAGLAFVHVAAWTDVARLPGPFDEADRSRTDGGRRRGFEWPGTRTAGYLVVFWLILATPGMAVSLGYVNSLTIGEDQYGAVDEVRAYSNDHDLVHPENYVLSRWPYNRMYNYFVNGESRFYGYAASNYPTSLLTNDASEWYGRYADRVGFVVVHRPDAPENSGSLSDRLATTYGSRSGSIPGLSHFRVVYDGEEVVAYRVVPGALVTGEGAANATLNVSTRVSVPGAEFVYHRRVRTDTEGDFSVRVPYPGEYEVGDRTVVVSEEAVERGAGVETRPATDVTGTSATLVGMATDVGTGSTANVAFRVWEAGEWNATSRWIEAGTVSSPGEFTSGVSGLDPGTEYVYVAWVQTPDGTTDVGERTTFTTDPPGTSAPRVDRDME